MDKTNDLRQLQHELKEIFLITENWWLKNVSNEKEKNIYSPYPEIVMVPLCLTRPPEGKFVIICIFSYYFPQRTVMTL